jgi:hypothetical protein
MGDHNAASAGLTPNSVHPQKQRQQQQQQQQQQPQLAKQRKKLPTGCVVRPSSVLGTGSSSTSQSTAPRKWQLICLEVEL